MAAPNPNAPQVLSEQILADARSESAAIVQRARREAESLLAQAAAEADKLRQERLTKARAEAGRRAELILATVQVEADRLRSDRVESLLQSVREEASARLARDGFESRETVVALASEAVSQMKGETFAVQLSPADCVRFGAGLAEEIIRQVGRSQLSLTIAKEPALTGRGLVVRDLEGRQVWDNQFEQRLERLWPELRRQTAVQTGLIKASGSKGSAT